MAVLRARAEPAPGTCAQIGSPPMRFLTGAAWHETRSEVGFSPPPVGSRYQPEFATAAEIRDLTKQAVDFGAFARVQLQKAHYGSGESTRALLRWERLECTKRITSCPIEADLLQGQAKKFIHGFNAEHLNLGGGKELKSVHMSSQSTCGHAFPHQQAF